jgi:hypothetical protein
MKKLSYVLLMLFAVIFASCGGSDDNTVTASFEGKLTTANSYYQSTSTTASGSYFKDNFKDNAGLVTFDHYYSIYANVRYYAGFTYTNSTDVKTANSVASICGQGKTGSIYLSAYCSDWTPAIMTLNNPSKYTFNGCYVSNSVYAYNCMTTDNLSPATHFKKGSSYYVTAVGLDSNGKQISGATSTVYLANYTTDSSTPSKEWEWLDLTPLKSAVKVQFNVTTTDVGQWGANTSTNICVDAITLDEK